MTVPRIISLGFVLLTLAHPWASVAAAESPFPPRRAVPLTWCALGTSITWYNDHVSSAFTKGYETRVMERIRFDGFANRGVNGGCVASAIKQVIPAGLYTVEHGINDWGNRVPPGTMDDYENDTGTGTFAGGYRKVIDAIRAANPEAVVILCTPRKGYGFGGFLPDRCDAQQPKGYFLKDYADLVRAIAAKEHYPLTDFFATCGEQDELASLSIDVALHPNDAGYQRMADELVRVLLQRFPNAPVLADDDGELHGDAEMIPIPDDPWIQPGDLVRRAFLSTSARLAFKGVNLDEVEPVVAEMAGGWIPGSPYEASVHHIRRNAKKKTLVCQFQTRPPDGCLRCVAVEFRQHGADITAKILWARYILNGPEPGVDFDAPGFGNAPIAMWPDSVGYGIPVVVFAKRGERLTLPPEPTAAARQAATALLEGVDSIDIPGGIPGPIVCIGPNAFPLVQARIGAGDRQRCAIAAAAIHGWGRVVYLGHPGFLDAGDDATRRLVANAVRWLAKDKSVPRLANLGHPPVGEVARSLGFDCIDAPASLDGFDVVLCNNISDDKVATLASFVERGGGLLAAGLGWGWRYYRPEKEMASLSTQFPDNQLLAPMGLVMGGGYAVRFPDGRFPVITEPVRGVSGDDALTLAATKDYIPLSLRQQAHQTLQTLVEALPRSAQPGFTVRLDKLLDAAGKATPPSSKNPVKDGLARIALVSGLERWQSDLARVWPADPAHTAYPGAAKPGWEKALVTRSVSVDGTIPRWHSTGVFAPAGAPLTVTLPAGAESLGLRLRIGTSGDNLLRVADAWRRAPLVSAEIPLGKRETTLSSPFGGLVYIVVPDGGIAGWSGEVSLSGGIAAPWFRLGRDSAADFARQCADTHAPQGEIEGESFVITSETAQLRRVDDPAWIAAFWDRILAADLALADLPPRRSPERICSDVQLTTGWLHNGYPLMYHVGSAGKDALDWVVDKPALERGDAWGVFHEIGHNHQSGDWTPDGFGEVTVNLFTAYAVAEVCGADFRAEGFAVSTAEQTKRIEKFKVDGISYDHLKRDVFLALEPYLRIAETYGWDVYRKTFAAYHAPGFAKPKDDAEKWAVFATLLSDAAGADLAAVFAAWGVPVPEAIRADCAARHPAAPDSLLP